MGTTDLYRMSQLERRTETVSKDNAHGKRSMYRNIRLCMKCMNRSREQWCRDVRCHQLPATIDQGSERKPSSVVLFQPDPGENGKKSVTGKPANVDVDHSE